MIEYVKIIPKCSTQAKSKDDKMLVGYRGIPSANAGAETQFDYQSYNINIAPVTALMVSAFEQIMLQKYYALLQPFFNTLS